MLADNDLKITMRKVSELREYENNPRKITAESVKFVAKSIRKFGFLQPIVIDAKGVIVCGHVRYRAAKALMMTVVPCVIADDLSPEQIRAFRLADNKVATISVWDNDKLLEEFAKLTSNEFSMVNLGFDPAMFGIDDETTGGDVSDVSGELNLDEFNEDEFKHECPHCGMKF